MLSHSQPTIGAVESIKRIARHCTVDRKEEHLCLCQVSMGSQLWTIGRFLDAELRTPTRPISCKVHRVNSLGYGTVVISIAKGSPKGQRTPGLSPFPGRPGQNPSFPGPSPLQFPYPPFPEFPGLIPPGQGPLGQRPPWQGQGPPWQGPPDQGPQGRNPPGQGPSDQGPLWQGPPGQGSPGPIPPGQGPQWQSPPGQGSSGQIPTGQGQPVQRPPGQGSSGQEPTGQRPPEQGSAGQGSSGEVTQDFVQFENTPDNLDRLRHIQPGELVEELSGQVEGDMVLTEEQYSIREENKVLPYEKYLWPDAVVYYEIEKSHFSDSQIGFILKAMKKIERLSCVLFKQRNQNQKDYVRIHGSKPGCFSNLGRVGGQQQLNLHPAPVGTRCFKIGTIIHELFHVLGFIHMQSAKDRDNWLLIMWKNIQPGYVNAFKKFEAGQSFRTQYDYGSVMHYGTKAFGDGRITLMPKKKTSKTIGQRIGMSQSDVTRLNRMYDCWVGYEEEFNWDS
ncbi:astacin-like metalloendopeptidase [Uranotaenia lowii]|uniref:astacin-like metalloendopeptidase n=1 Tax=Uranotaenia lowii TaxID=190385 RepID=UPI0024799B57|nr:astacin-like metalloendopeptidase [Uranotaenia lowii]